MAPLLNPLIEKSHSFIEDDYVLVKKLGEKYNPKEIKEKVVRIVEPDSSRTIRKVICIEGEWCPTFSGFTFIQSGHAWVKPENAEGYTVCAI